MADDFRYDEKSLPAHASSTETSTPLSAAEAGSIRRRQTDCQPGGPAALLFHPAEVPRPIPLEPSLRSKNGKRSGRPSIRGYVALPHAGKAAFSFPDSRNATILRVRQKIFLFRKKRLAKQGQIVYLHSCAEVVKLVDTLGSGSSSRSGVRVRVSSSAPVEHEKARDEYPELFLFFLLFAQRSPLPLFTTLPFRSGLFLRPAPPLMRSGIEIPPRMC